MSKPVAVTKPEETENFIHIPVRSASSFVDDSFRTITLSESQGIKSVIGKLKSDPDGPTKIQKYMFDKDKGWTMEKAKKWVKDHKEDGLPADVEKEESARERLLQDAQIRAEFVQFCEETGGNDVSWTAWAEFTRVKMPWRNEKLDTHLYASRVSQKDNTKFISGDIIRGKSHPNGKLFNGFFTSDVKDEVGDIITREATQKAIKKYRKWSNVRYMHQPVAIGKVQRMGEDDELEWNEMEFLVTHDDVVKDIEAGVLSALSVGIIVNKWEDLDGKQDALAGDKEKSFWGPMKITDYDLVEVSVVDHPANYDAFIKSGDDSVMRRKVLEFRDPRTEFDLLLNTTQLDKGLDVAVVGNKGQRVAFIRNIETGTADAVSEVDGLTSSSVHVPQDVWDILKDEVTTLDAAKSLLSKVEGDGSGDAQPEADKDASPEGSVSGQDVEVPPADVVSPIDTALPTGEAVSESTETEKVSESELLLRGFADLSDTVKGSLSQLTEAITSLVTSLKPPAGNEEDSEVDALSLEPEDVSVETATEKTSVVADRVEVKLEDGGSLDLAKSLGDLAKAVENLAKQADAEAKAREQLESSIKSLSEKFVTKAEFEEAKRPQDRKSHVDVSNPADKGRDLLSSQDIAKMPTGELRDYFRTELDRMLNGGQLSSKG